MLTAQDLINSRNTGDDWVLVDVAYLSKVELKGALK